MGYRVREDETLDAAVRRCARELVDRSLKRLEGPAEADVEEVVHDVRKDCKKARALLRLVRPVMGSAYRPANAQFRGAARQLSEIRDAHALLETFDVLLGHSGAPRKRLAARVRHGLCERAAQATAAVAECGPRIQSARALLVEARGHIDTWSLPPDVTEIARGAARTYGRGREGLFVNRNEPTDLTLHDWRKRVKYGWYHVSLLRNAAPEMLRGWEKGFKRLSELLGEDHDLAVLTAQLTGDPAAFGGQEAVEDVLRAARVRRDVLQARSFSLGARLYVEEPKAYGARVAAYWRVWQRDGL